MSAHCKNHRYVVKYETNVCLDCGAVKTSRASEWGRAAGREFASLREARYFREHGCLPQEDGTPDMHSIVSAAIALVTSRDWHPDFDEEKQLESQLRRFGYLSG